MCLAGMSGQDIESDRAAARKKKKENEKGRRVTR